jgi:predicted AlkP superfamily phosphohydrolase/phosphomutase
LGFNSIYINLKGRESQGIVENKEDIEKEIIEKLEALTDNNKTVVNKVYRTKDIHSGNYVKDGPDLIIGFNPGYRMAWQTAVGGLTDDVIFDNEKVWKGDHLVDPKFVPGVLFSNVKLKKENASQMDLIPTVLDIYDIDIPEDMDGESLLR